MTTEKQIENLAKAARHSKQQRETALQVANNHWRDYVSLCQQYEIAVAQWETENQQCYPAKREL